MRVVGGEFGSTTGRARRCGWLDLPMLKYSCMLNGVTQLIMMKADVLNGFKEIDVCTEYIIDGKNTEEIPFMPDETIGLKYITLKGWNSEIVGDEMPPLLEDYVKLVTDYIEIPITIVSVGPDRNQTITLKK